MTDDDVVHHLPPLTRPEAPVPVVVRQDGEWHPGMANAWRGEHVHVTFTTGPGMKYVQWVPPDRVRRIEGLLQDLDE